MNALFRQLPLSIAAFLVCILFTVSSVFANDAVTISSFDDIKAMKKAVKKPGLFQDAYRSLKSDLDNRMSERFDVPMPKDPGGGYTHEQHKKNYKIINDAGVIYQLSGEKKYANYAKKMLLAYAGLYPKLPRHPVIRSKSPGRLFWQSLNEAVWLVYSIQGYAAIVDSLSAEEKDTIENELFMNVATFLSSGQPFVFNRIHNHGTWATAAVGMTGYVLNNPELVEQSLYGLDKSGAGGFLKQLDILFSPDGYFNEGPYYQRYALMPFVLFAKTIEVNEPQRKIFEYRDGVLRKAVYTAVEMSYNGLLFPINDAIKDKGIDTIELIYAVSIAYGMNGDAQLLDMAKSQDRILLFGDGLRIAQGLAANKLKSFNYPTALYRDGSKGEDGALVVLRSGHEFGHEAVLAKYTSQGLGHGHFDKLGWSFYDNGYEIVIDYGAARFLNIATKSGGGYLKENTSWAKQTVSHNTLVVDEKSHFGGSTKIGNSHSPEILGFLNSPSLKAVAAKMSSAYDSVVFTRAHALINSDLFEHDIVIDILNIDSASGHQYDLPLYYDGHIVDLNFPVKANDESLATLGSANGYQHLWKKAQAKPGVDLAQITWLKDNRFYTYSTRTDNSAEAFFVELGANDPNFNLRRESGVMFRVKNASKHSFVSALEPHGEYNGRDEYVTNVKSQIKDIVKVTQEGVDFIVITTTQGQKLGLGLSYSDDESVQHKAVLDGKSYRWNGLARLFSL